MMGKSQTDKTSFLVAHFKHTFFEKSDTFIYHYLTHMSRFIPICLSWRLDNIWQFPFPRCNMVDLKVPLSRIKKFLSAIFKRVLNRNYYFERIIRERGVRLIHAHSGRDGLQVLHLKRKLGIPMVTSFYGASLFRAALIDPILKLLPKLFVGCEMFLVEGEFMKKRLLGLGCPLQKIEIQRIAIPVDTIPFKERRPKGSERVKLLFCGRFTEKNGLRVALEALKKVREQNRDVSLCAVGDGELKGDIQHYVDQNKMGEWVTMPGFLDYRDYLQRAAEADLFIHPALRATNGDGEGGGPIVILEAQAMGLPVISTYHADIPNMVVPDRSALLCAERDSEALARNILFLLENQHLWAQMGKTGRAFVEEFHDIKKEAKNLEEKYKVLIGKR